jgi:starch synthase
MRIGILTREYPPEVYGGAGVHVDFLVRELKLLTDRSGSSVEVHCMGAPRDGAIAHSENEPFLEGANPALRTLAADLAMADQTGDCDIVHSHTWYANMGGHLAKLLHDIPHVVTSHSLEPHRPWKAEQLGGYRVSSWAERTAYEGADAVIAVSNGSKADVLDAYPELDEAKIHIVHNGIDADFYAPDPDTSVLERLGVDLDRPSAVFVGRITRQKGVPHLLRAALDFDAAVQVVLLAGAADTPELKAETDAAIAELHARRDGVFVVSEMLPREQVRQVLTHSTVFVCPSVYEPLGIVNLEAMACETAVVASDVGGIPDVVRPGQTGELVHFDPDATRQFEDDLAAAVNRVVADPDLARRYGVAGRQRAIDEFGWDVAAEKTMAIYDSLL